MPRATLFIALTLACLWPAVTTPMALVAGLLFALSLQCPAPLQVQKWTKYLLQVSVVGLGFGIPISQVLEAGRDGFVTAVLTISFALAMGYLLSRILGMRDNTAALITVGTAICGGSAIAAIAPTIKAKSQEIGVAMGAVFSLNAVALLLFPWIGKVTQMSPSQFGIWSALAIHDTSSVVGAAATFGAVALAIATTVKLSRVIFILPIAAFLALRLKSERQLNIPWFVLFFLLAAVMRSLIADGAAIFDAINFGAKQTLCIVLFWIGAGLNREVLSRVGLKPFAFAISLWISLGAFSFFLVKYDLT